MSMKSLVLLAVFLIPAPARGAQEPGVTQQILKRASQSWDGAAFQYPEGVAEMAVVRINIPAGVTLPWHCHPVPLAGVLTKGTLTVEKADGAKVTIGAGEGLIEVSRQWHRGRAGEDAEILVVYAGAKGQPLTIGRDAGANLTAPCR